jgi:hypothetical protein
MNQINLEITLGAAIVATINGLLSEDETNRMIGMIDRLDLELINVSHVERYYEIIIKRINDKKLPITADRYRSWRMIADRFAMFAQKMNDPTLRKKALRR